MRALLAPLVAAVALLVVPAASAKHFGPGDVRVCNATRCGREVMPQLGSFYYSGPALAHLRQPALGTGTFELRFRNGYATGIVAGSSLGRFLSYGVHLERFDAGTWYAVPPRLAAELRRLTAQLAPIPLTRAALAATR